MTLPLHLLYQSGEDCVTTAYNIHQYITDLNKDLQATFAFAPQKFEKTAEGHKAYYDQKASHDVLQVGDRIWYYILAPKTGQRLKPEDSLVNFCHSRQDLTLSLINFSSRLSNQNYQGTKGTNI